MYVPDDKMLGNPGVFGFIKKAVQTVGKVLTGQTTVKIPTMPTPVVNVQLPQGSVPAFGKIDFSNPLVIGGAVLLAVLVLPKLLGGRR